MFLLCSLRVVAFFLVQEALTSFYDPGLVSYETVQNALIQRFG